jgi:hypothetical protein
LREDGLALHHRAQMTSVACPYRMLSMIPLTSPSHVPAGMRSLMPVSANTRTRRSSNGTRIRMPVRPFVLCNPCSRKTCSAHRITVSTAPVYSVGDRSCYHVKNYYDSVARPPDVA